MGITDWLIRGFQIHTHPNKEDVFETLVPSGLDEDRGQSTGWDKTFITDEDGNVKFYNRNPDNDLILESGKLSLADLKILKRKKK
ncbi:MAG: hypothetical protein IT280_01655 [Ignavibacteria bacterium]|nr:hypothetical protein [Ignavibacteria bacterium]